VTNINLKFDSKLDLVLERTVNVEPEQVWAAWTKPEHLVHWFTPEPWKTIDCEVDLRPGGMLRWVMQSPEGQEFPYVCCYLDVVENRRLIWTTTLEPGYRPSPKSAEDELFFTAVISIEPDGEGTKYTATAIHRSEEDRKKHEDMGFHEGWGKVLDQLVEYAKGL
jgi:uncharacterized protein YndB with AHSA1/START domain